MQGRHKSSALAMALHHSCINPLICAFVNLCVIAQGTIMLEWINHFRLWYAINIHSWICTCRKHICLYCEFNHIKNEKKSVISFPISSHNDIGIEIQCFLKCPTPPLAGLFPYTCLLCSHPPITHPCSHKLGLTRANYGYKMSGIQANPIPGN